MDAFEPLPSSPPSPRLRSGHLLDDGIEVRELIHASPAGNIYSAEQDFLDYRVIEIPAEDPVAQIPDSLKQYFPEVVLDFSQDGRHYKQCIPWPGSPFTHAAIPCWEPPLAAFLLRISQIFRQLAAHGIDLHRLHPGDIFLNGHHFIFATFPRVAAVPSDPEPLIHALVKDLCYARLIPRITRNLDAPLRCLGLSTQLEQILSNFINGEADLNQFVNALEHRIAAPPADWRIAGGTDKGLVRRDNEDAFAWSSMAMTTYQIQLYGHLLAVADGMGGHHRGEAASHHAVNHWMNVMAQSALHTNWNKVQNPDLTRVVLDAFDHTQTVMALEPELTSKGPGASEKPGSTLVSAMLVDRLVFLGNCGDSRAYRIGADAIQRLSKDHSLVQLFIDRGQITEEEALDHDQSNIITSFMGIEPKSFKRDVCVHYLEPGETLLLCSDGLTDMITEREILRIVTAANHARDAVKHLIQAAKDAGGEDNITVVLAMDDAPSTFSARSIS